MIASNQTLGDAMKGFCREAVSFSDDIRAAHAIRIIEDLSKRFEPLGFGNYRIVFKLRGDHVLKFPLNEAGEFCNDGEASWKDDYLAAGRYLELGGFVCVVQECVQDATFDVIREILGEVPDWVCSIDCGQVGFNRSGQLKAYDFVHP
jgi:hypothetical protein